MALFSRKFKWKIPFRMRLVLPDLIDLAYSDSEVFRVHDRFCAMQVSGVKFF